MVTKTKQLTAEEFRSRVARFGDLKTNVEEYISQNDVKKDAYEHVAVKEIFYLMGKPNPNVDAATQPALATGEGCSVYIVGTPPGDGPTLHAHMKTWENFTVLKGRYRFSAGDYGQYTAELGPFDTFSCPPGVSRKFENISDEHANLLVVITGEVEALDDIALADDIGEYVAEKWGEDGKAGLERVGMRFDIKKEQPTDSLDLRTN